MVDCNPVPKKIQELKWNIAAKIPAEERQTKSLGYAGPVAGTSNGMLIIGGGANFPDSMPWLGGAKKYHDELWVYNPELKNFKLFKLPYNLAYSANVSTQNGVVSAGGENETGIVAGVLVTQWNGTEAVVTKLPNLPVAITNAAAAIVGNDLYVAGGETKEAASARLFKLNMVDFADGWRELKNLPQPTSHAVLLAVDESKLYLIGGRKKTTSGISDLYASNYEYDIAADKWNAKKSLPYALCAGTGAAFGDDYIVMFGGDKGETFHKAETIISKINAGKDSTIKEQLIKEKIQIQSSHPGFSKEVLWYDIKNDEWIANGTIPFDVPATTTAVKIADKVFIPSGEIKAGIRTPQILVAPFDAK